MIMNNKNTLKKNRNMSLHFEKEIDPEAKNEIVNFFQWFNKEYLIDTQIDFFFKKDYRVRNEDGKMVFSTSKEPYLAGENYKVWVSTGDYCVNRYLDGIEQSIWRLLYNISYEMIKFLQWSGNSDFCLTRTKKQHYYLAKIINDRYMEFRVSKTNHLLLTNKVGKIREKKGLSLADLAWETGIEFNLLTEIEKGMSDLSLGQALLICEALGEQFETVFDFDKIV